MYAINSTKQQTVFLATHVANIRHSRNVCDNAGLKERKHNYRTSQSQSQSQYDICIAPLAVRESSAEQNKMTQDTIKI